MIIHPATYATKILPQGCGRMEITMTILLTLLPLVHLILCTRSDIKSMKISLINCSFFLIFGIFLQLLAQTSAINLIIAALPGILLFLLGLLSPAHIGIGDGLMITICGIYTGFSDIIPIIFISCLGGLLFIVINFLFTKHLCKKVPFAPFLLISFCIIKIWRLL